MVRRKTGSVSISPSSSSTRVGVVVLPPGLVLLRAAVVVDGEDGAADLAGGGAEVDRGLAAVGADLERRAVRQPLAGVAVQQQALVLGHEALRVAGVLEQVVTHHGVHASRVSRCSPADKGEPSLVQARIASTRHARR